jgi:hypothetical protein
MDRRFRVTFLLIIFVIFSSTFVFLNYKIQLLKFWKNSTLKIHHNATEIIFYVNETNLNQTVENFASDTNGMLERSDNDTLTSPNDILILLFTGTL